MRQLLLLYVLDGKTLVQYALGKSDTSFTIPYGVECIGDYAFSSCNSLTDVYYTGTESDWAGITVKSGNENLTGTNIHYNYIPEE